MNVNCAVNCLFPVGKNRINVHCPPYSDWVVQKKEVQTWPAYYPKGRSDRQYFAKMTQYLLLHLEVQVNHPAQICQVNPKQNKNDLLYSQVMFCSTSHSSNCQPFHLTAHQQSIKMVKPHHYFLDNLQGKLLVGGSNAPPQEKHNGILFYECKMAWASGSPVAISPLQVTARNLKSINGCNFQFAQMLLQVAYGGHSGSHKSLEWFTGSVEPGSGFWGSQKALARKR